MDIAIVTFTIGIKIILLSYGIVELHFINCDFFLLIFK